MECIIILINVCVDYTTPGVIQSHPGFRDWEALFVLCVGGYMNNPLDYSNTPTHHRSGHEAKTYMWVVSLEHALHERFQIVFGNIL